VSLFVGFTRGALDGLYVPIRGGLPIYQE